MKLLIAGAAILLLGSTCQQAAKLPAASSQRSIVIAPAAPVNGERPVLSEAQPAELPPRSPIQPGTAAAPARPAVQASQGCAGAGFPARGCPPP